jgi:fluoroacetyl-CoA thioesterase
MNQDAVAQIFFSDTFSVVPEQMAREIFRLPHHCQSCIDRSLDAMGTGSLVAMLESMCMRQMQACIDCDKETIVGSWLECQHWAPIPPGALIRISGWVTAVEGQRATFWVQASDEQEIVCEGRIRLAIVQREQIEKKIQRKCEAIKRRQLFAAA